MSHLRLTDSAKSKNIIITAAASFLGMTAAVPVSAAILSLEQPAHAEQVQSQMATTANDANYKQYLQGYTQGYLASVKQDNSSSIQVGNCAVAPATTSVSTTTVPEAVTSSAPVASNYKPMSPKVWATNNSVNNSYNTYTSSTTTTNNINTTVNKNKITTIDSNNTTNSGNSVQSSLTVSNSTGVVAASGTSATGNVMTGAAAENKNSNNTTTTNTSVAVNDSFNKNSNNQTTVSDSGNTTNNTTTNTTTNNTTNTTVNDSFNKIDATLNNNSNNTTVTTSEEHHHA